MLKKVVGVFVLTLAIDEPWQSLASALEALLSRKPQVREDRALFRSLNVAAGGEVAGGIDVTLYDLGRLIALWVSACEILARQSAGHAGVKEVYDLLHQVCFVDQGMKLRKYKAFVSRRNGITRTERRNLACWVYGQLYHARCDFLPGNPVRGKTVSISLARPALLGSRLACTDWLLRDS